MFPPCTGSQLVLTPLRSCARSRRRPAAMARRGMPLRSLPLLLLLAVLAAAVAPRAAALDALTGVAVYRSTTATW